MCIENNIKVCFLSNCRMAIFGRVSAFDLISIFVCNVNDNISYVLNDKNRAAVSLRNLKALVEINLKWQEPPEGNLKKIKC